MVRKHEPRPRAWLPADYDAADIEAVKAVHAGEADAYQQRRALEWIIKIVAGTYEEPFRSDGEGGERETSYALGRAYVGRQVVKAINMPPALIAKLRSNNG